MPVVALISNRFAQRYLSGENLVGKHIRQGEDASALPWLTIVGVVGDIKYDPWSKQEPLRCMYRHPQFPSLERIRQSAHRTSLTSFLRLRGSRWPTSTQNSLWTRFRLLEKSSRTR